MFFKIVSTVFSWLLDGKMIKTSAASAIGSGAVVIGIIEAKMMVVKDMADKDKQQIIQYVDFRHEKAIDKIDVLIESHKDLKQTLNKIDDRLFNIKKKLKE